MSTPGFRSSRRTSLRAWSARTSPGAFFPFTLLYGDPAVGLTASLALFAASSVATVVAMTLPLLLSRLGHDPAFGSGPLATVVQDLLSIMVYFGFALWLVD